MIYFRNLLLGLLGLTLTLSSCSSLDNSRSSSESSTTESASSSEKYSENEEPYENIAYDRKDVFETSDDVVLGEDLVQDKVLLECDPNIEFDIISYYGIDNSNLYSYCVVTDAAGEQVQLGIQPEYDHYVVYKNGHYEAGQSYDIYLNDDVYFLYYNKTVRHIHFNIQAPEQEEGELSEQADFLQISNTEVFEAPIVHDDGTVEVAITTFHQEFSESLNSDKPLIIIFSDQDNVDPLRCSNLQYMKFDHLEAYKDGYMVYGSEPHLDELFHSIDFYTSRPVELNPDKDAEFVEQQAFQALEQTAQYGALERIYQAEEAVSLRNGIRRPDVEFTGGIPISYYDEYTGTNGLQLSASITLKWGETEVKLQFQYNIALRLIVDCKFEEYGVYAKIVYHKDFVTSSRLQIVLSVESSSKLLPLDELSRDPIIDADGNTISQYDILVNAAERLDDPADFEDGFKTCGTLQDFTQNLLASSKNSSEKDCFAQYMEALNKGFTNQEKVSRSKRFGFLRIPVWIFEIGFEVALVVEKKLSGSVFGTFECRSVTRSTADFYYERVLFGVTQRSNRNSDNESSDINFGIGGLVRYDFRIGPEIRITFSISGCSSIFNVFIAFNLFFYMTATMMGYANYSLTSGFAFVGAFSLEIGILCTLSFGISVIGLIELRAPVASLKIPLYRQGTFALPIRPAYKYPSYNPYISNKATFEIPTTALCDFYVLKPSNLFSEVASLSTIHGIQLEYEVTEHSRDVIEINSNGRLTFKKPNEHASFILKVRGDALFMTTAEFECYVLYRPNASSSGGGTNYFAGSPAEYYHDTQTGLTYRMNASRTHYVVCGYSGSDLAVKIPEFVSGVEVLEIADHAFENSNVTSVDAPYIESIGDYAFAGCKNLQLLTRCRRLKTIGDSCFNGCTSLTRIEDSTDKNAANITSIGEYCFYNCRSLLGFDFGQLSEVPQYSFFGCEKLSTITLSSTITSLGAYCFYGNANLSRVFLAPVDSLDVGFGVFQQCGRVLLCTDEEHLSFYRDRFASLRDSVIVLEHEEQGFIYEIDVRTTDDEGNAIEPYSFARLIKYTGSDTKVTLPRFVADDLPVEEIGQSCFRYNPTVKEIEVHSGIRTIGSYAFANCSDLRSVTLLSPTVISRVGSALFFGSNDNLKIYVPDDLYSSYRAIGSPWRSYSHIIGKLSWKQ